MKIKMLYEKYCILPSVLEANEPLNCTDNGCTNIC